MTEIISYPVRISITRPAPARDLRGSEKDVLRTGRQVQPPRKIIQPPTTLASDVDAALAPPPPVTFADLRDGYKFLRERTEEIIDVLKIKTDGMGLDMPLNKFNDPETWIAAHKMWAGDPKVVTFSMYLQALQYTEDLGRALAER